MSNPFGNLTNSSELEAPTDRLGGFTVFDADLYEVRIKMAFAMTSSGGARGMRMTFETADGKEYREDLYVTNKKGENFYHSTQTGKNAPLPGFTVMNDIAMCTVGTELQGVKFEEKQVNQWDKDANAEIPKAAMVATDLIGKVVTLGVIKMRKNKSKKLDNGSYADTNEETFQNQIDKVFHTESRRTVVEAKAGKEKGVFIDGWADKNRGQIRDQFKPVQGGNTAGHTAPPVAGNTAPSGGGAPNLFG